MYIGHHIPGISSLKDTYTKMLTEHWNYRVFSILMRWDFSKHSGETPLWCVFSLLYTLLFTCTCFLLALCSLHTWPDAHKAKTLRGTHNHIPKTYKDSSVNKITHTKIPKKNYKPEWYKYSKNEMEQETNILKIEALSMLEAQCWVDPNLFPIVSQIGSSDLPKNLKKYQRWVQRERVRVTKLDRLKCANKLQLIPREYDAIKASTLFNQQTYGDLHKSQKW
jgi:hypothetical protein